MSLLPDDEITESLLPPEEEEDIPMFIEDDSSPDVYESKRKKIVPKYKNLIPKRAYANIAGPIALIFDLLFAFIIYTFIKDPLADNGFVILDPSTWTLDGMLLGLKSLNIASLIKIGIMIFLMIIVTSVWISSQKNISKCPVCGKTNYKNYHVCSKCNYIFMSREIIRREILSVKLNNLDFTPEQVRQNFLDRKLADLDASYIKKVLEKNHFL
ncbi:MAG: hypothetical protein ACTSVI_08025 [Promethearchaeota archaeon]